uniref:Uncharacterized protein n=1 Tax=viral metagenome TaxID=1070528 RepID=A0A6C0AEN9_9ZZZZ
MFLKLTPLIVGFAEGQWSFLDFYLSSKKLKTKSIIKNYFIMNIFSIFFVDTIFGIFGSNILPFYLTTRIFMEIRNAAESSKTPGLEYYKNINFFKKK